MKDVIIVAKNAFIKTVEALNNNAWLFILLYAVVSVLISLLRVGSFAVGIFGGFLSYLLYIVEKTIYARALSDITLTNRLSTKNFFYNFGSYFINIMNTYFIVFIVKYVFQIFVTSPMLSSNQMVVIYTIAMFVLENIVFSPILETIYVDNVGSIEAFKKCLSFMKENWLPWILLNVPYILMLFVASAYSVIDIRKNVLLSILMIIVPPVYLIFRGKLYYVLNNSNKRKREFINEFNKVRK